MRGISIAGLSALLVVSLSCAGRDDPGERDDVIGGTPDDSGQYPFVAQLVCGTVPIGICSGTLIGPHTFLTAHHCTFKPFVGGDCPSGGGAGSSYVHFGEQAGVADSGGPPDYRVDHFIRPDHTGNDMATRDFAVVKLATAVVEVTPASVARIAPYETQLITMVGYGASVNYLDPGCTGSTDIYGCAASTRRVGENKVLRVYDADRYFTSDATATSQYACNGDSGGPAFPEGGGPLVLGVVSHGDIDQPHNCRTFNAWSMTSSDVDWILFQLLTPGSAVATAYARFGGNAFNPSTFGDPATEEVTACGGTSAELDLATLGAATGQAAYAVQGDIRAKYRLLGGGCSVLGYPMTDEKPTSCEGARFNSFERGAITWSSSAGANETHGPIRAEWASLGYECGLLGLPITDQKPTSCAGGSYNNFERGAITYRPDVGAHYTQGPIRAAWGAKHYECGCLGLPIGDPQVIGSVTTGTTVQKFEHGTITMINGSGATSVSCAAPPNPCSAAADGVYCGDSRVDGFAGTGLATSLYTCHGHTVTATQACGTDCFIQPPGHPDTCDACAFAADGVYCGSSTADGFPGSGQSYDLYFCHGHKTTEVDICPAGCTIHTSGADQCTTCAGRVCGNTCCPAGSWCGQGGRCCTECSSSCPC